MQEKELMQLRREQIKDVDEWDQLERHIQELQGKLSLVKERVEKRKIKIKDLE